MKIFLLFVFWCLWFLNFSVRLIISPLLPLIEDEFALSHAFAGGIFFFIYSGSILAVFSSGYISLRIGYKRSIAASYLILIATLFCLRYAQNYPSFAFLCFFLGVGVGMYLPCAIPLITAIFDPGKWGKAISFHETAAGFSFLAIPLLTVFAMQYFHWRALFLILSGSCLIIVMVFFIFSPDPRPVKEKKTGLSFILRRPEFWIITVLWTFAAVDSMGIYNIIPLFLVKEKGMPLEFSNNIFGISRIGGFLAMIVIGFLLDRYRIKSILAVIILATGITTIGLALAQKFWLLMTMLILQATFCIIFFPAGLVAISKLTSPNERSTFTGTTMGISGIFGTGLAPFILGALADVWNFQIGIFALGVLTIITCLLLKILQDI